MRPASYIARLQQIEKSSCTFKTLATAFLATAIVRMAPASTRAGRSIERRRGGLATDVPRGHGMRPGVVAIREKAAPSIDRQAILFAVKTSATVAADMPLVMRAEISTHTAMTRRGG